MAKDKTVSALVTEQGAVNNPHLNKVIQNLRDGYKPNAASKANHNLSLAVHRTAMIENPRDIYAWKKDADGNAVKPQVLFRKGWYLSVEEAAMRDAILADEDNQKLNETIWKQMEDSGMEVEKAAGSAKEVRVVTGVV